MKNYDLHLDITVNEEVAKKYAFTPREKYEKLKEKNPNINIVNVESAEDGLRRVQKGELFGHIDALSIIAYAIQKHGFVDLKVAGSLEFDEQLSIASRKDEVLFEDVDFELNTSNKEMFIKMMEI